MDKQSVVDFSKTIEKFGIALCGALYPSQMDQLQRALSIYQKSGRIQKLDDSFTNLALRMIVADLIWQEKQREGVN